MHLPGRNSFFAGNRIVLFAACLAVAALSLAACGAPATPQPGGVTVTAQDGTAPAPPTVQTLPPTAGATATTAPSATSLPEPATATSAPSNTPPQPTATTPPTPAATATSAPVAGPPYEDRTGPSSLLASYYDAINRRDYARAWSYWDSPPNPSYEDFVQGFADTASVLLAVRPPTFVGAAAGSRYANVPALLSATHTDGSRHNFVACFVTRHPNLEGPGIEQVWSLYSATVQPAPGNSTDALLLADACDPEPQTSYEDRTGAVRLLASYYNAINLGEYDRAWGYWETPPNPSLQDFVQGFADTESVMLVVSPPTRLEGAAGSVYTAIPALMSALHTDGSRHNFVACFVARRPNLGGPGVEQLWSLYDATVQPAPGNGTDVTLLQEACATR